MTSLTNKEIDELKRFCFEGDDADHIGMNNVRVHLMVLIHAHEERDRLLAEREMMRRKDDERIVDDLVARKLAEKERDAARARIATLEAALREIEDGETVRARLSNHEPTSAVVDLQLIARAALLTRVE